MTSEAKVGNIESAFDSSFKNWESIQEETSVGNEDLSGKLKKFFTKYLCQGQKLSKKQDLALQQLDENTSWQKRLMVKHRQEIGMLIPFVLLQTIWWCLATKHNFFQYFAEIQNQPNTTSSNTSLKFAEIQNPTPGTP